MLPESNANVAEEDVVQPGRVYVKQSSTSSKPVLLVFFDDGGCLVKYEHLDLFKFFVGPEVSGLELASPEIERAFLVEARRALLIALQTRR